MALRYEAWSPPWDPGGFKRKVAMMPIIDGTGSGSVGFLAFPGDSSVDISLANFDRLTDLVSDTEASLITVYDCQDDGTNTIIDEWILDRLPSRLSEDRRVSLSGPGLLSIFEKALVYAYDYPTSPALQGDWLWGGDNKLGNPFFSAAADTPAIFELEITATAGTYTLSDGTDTTLPIAFDAQASVIETRLQTDITAIDDRCVVTGTSVSPYLRTINVPIDSVSAFNLTINGASLTPVNAGTITRTQVNTLSYAPWEAAHALSVPANPEGYDTFQLSSAQAHSGGRSLAVNPSTIFPTHNRLPGVQQVVSVSPGQTYQLSIWIYPTSGTDRFRLGLFTTGEEIIDWTAANGATLTPNVWNQLVLNDVVIPEGINQAIIRAAWSNFTNTTYEPSLAYFDDAEMNEGLVPTSIGDIWQALLDDCTTDHSGDPRGTVLDWIDYSSFSNTLDSNGNAWNESALSFAARWGSNMSHVLDDTFNLGYEAELVRKATPSGGLTHDFHLYNPGGRDDDPSTAIHTGQPVKGGETLKRNPAATALLVGSTEGGYTEDTDATALANFGRLEHFLQDSEATGATSRQLLADNYFSFEAANRSAVRFEVIEAPGVPRPFVDYRPGDTIPMTMAPALAKQDRRVQRIDYVNTHPAQYVVVGSRILEGEAAAFDLIGRMWRRMNRPSGLAKKETPSTDGGVGSGSHMTIVVAASNASSFAKESAHFECNGTDDQVEIQAAVDLINNLAPTTGGIIQLTEGQFNLSWTGNGNLIDINGIGLSLKGMGPDATVLKVTGTPDVGSPVVLLRTSGSSVSDLRIEDDSTSAFSHYGIIANGSYGYVQNVSGYVTGTGSTFLDIGADLINVHNLIVDFSQNGVFGNGAFLTMSDCYISATDESLKYFTGDNCHWTNCHFFSTGDASVVGTVDLAGDYYQFSNCSVYVSGVDANSAVELAGNYMQMVGCTVRVSAAGPVCLEIGGGSNHHIVGNSFISSGFQAGEEVITVSGSNVVIANNTIEGGYHGISAPTSAQFLKILGNDINGQSGDGIRCVSSGAGQHKIADNNFWGIVGTAINVERSISGFADEVTITGNYIESATQHGIRLVAGRNSLISDNLLTQIGTATANTYDAIHVDGDSITVVNNKIVAHADTRYALNIAGGNNNVAYANDLGDSSVYATADSVDSGTTTQTSPTGGVIGGQFAY